jgi:hypothetical protein
MVGGASESPVHPHSSVRDMDAKIAQTPIRDETDMSFKLMTGRKDQGRR